MKTAAPKTPRRIVRDLIEKDEAEELNEPVADAIARALKEAYPLMDSNVAREWCNEPGRRRGLESRREARRERRRIGPRGQAYRRIIRTKITEGVSEVHYHATKGWRSYRHAA